MFARLPHAIFIATLLLLPVSVRAEEPPPEMQEMMQQMQQVGMQVMQNMAQQGINPQEFFGDVRQQMQDGTLDMNALQQKLVDKGLIDKETVAKLQTTAQTATMNSMKRQLDVTDAEWAALQPKIQRVIVLSGDVDSGGGSMRGMLAGIMRAQSPKSDVATKKLELSAAISNPAATPAEYQTRLSALREAKQKAKEELTAAQKELTELLTVRQEAVLASLGLL